VPRGAHGQRSQRLRLDTSALQPESLVILLTTCQRFRTRLAPVECRAAAARAGACRVRAPLRVRGVVQSTDELSVARAAARLLSPGPQAGSRSSLEFVSPMAGCAAVRGWRPRGGPDGAWRQAAVNTLQCGVLVSWSLRTAVTPRCPPEWHLRACLRCPPSGQPGAGLTACVDDRTANQFAPGG
jgi:hypothetical protein